LRDARLTRLVSGKYSYLLPVSRDLRGAASTAACTDTTEWPGSCLNLSCLWLGCAGGAYAHDDLRRKHFQILTPCHGISIVRYLHRHSVQGDTRHVEQRRAQWLEDFTSFQLTALRFPGFFFTLRETAISGEPRAALTEDGNSRSHALVLVLEQSAILQARVSVPQTSPVNAYSWLLNDEDEERRNQTRPTAPHLRARRTRLHPRWTRRFGLPHRLVQTIIGTSIQH